MATNKINATEGILKLAELVAEDNIAGFMEYLEQNSTRFITE
jgi:hypothetical protein